jgi:hypothetical protein
MEMTTEQIRKLEERLSAVEQTVQSSSEPKFVDLAETTFKTVLDADYHLDDKASRILSAMAFLTAAAAAIFAKAYSPMLPQDDLRLRITKALSSFTIEGAPSNSQAVESVVHGLQGSSAQLFGFELSLVAFLGYMLFALVAAGFYLAALGPSLNKPSTWLVSGKQIRSRLFYDFIGQVDSDDWQQYWESYGPSKTLALQAKFENDYIFESRLLAEKARDKFLWLSFGALFLRLALLCLIVLVASLFSVKAQIAWFLSVAGCALLVGVFAFQNITKTPKDPTTKRLSKRLLGVWPVCLLLIILLLLSYLVLIALNAKLMAFGAVALFALALLTLRLALIDVRKHKFNEPLPLSLILATVLLLLSGAAALAYR